MDVVSFEAAVVVVLGCLVVGLALIAVEVLVTPGFGVPGIVGAVLIVFAVAFALVTGGPLWGLLTLAAASAILYAGGRTVGLTFGHRIVLGETLGRGGLAAGGDESMLGAEGTTISPLRPTGFARFGLRRVEVSSRSGFLERGTRVVVVEVDGTRTLVDAVEDAQS